MGEQGSTMIDSWVNANPKLIVVMACIEIMKIDVLDLINYGLLVIGKQPSLRYFHKSILP